MNDAPSPDGAQPPQDAPAAAAEDGPMIRVLGQYVRDLSFENPNPLDPPPANSSPNIELGIDVKAESAAERKNTFEVSLKLSAQAKRPDGQVVFIVELLYSGLFEIKGASQADAEPMLLIECPRLLFPFARRLVAEVTREGGFPPLLIDPIDFVKLYRSQRAGQAAEAPPS